MDKRGVLVILISIIFVGLILGVGLTYFLVVPCCLRNPELVYTSYSQPNNSTNKFSLIILNAGFEEATITDLQKFSFSNDSHTLYPSLVYKNDFEISFPLIFEPGEEVNVTLELNWHFIIGLQYILTVEYDNGKSFDLTFIANESS
ncbi:MAG: hypothetical protein ACTSPC_11005 [Candidatus Heimdallarchaeota archaeon]